jgi:sodium pump decarboxylase gamma subunit
MIIAGVKLTFLGMAVVYSFLLLLVLCIKLSYLLFSAKSARELDDIEAAELNRKRRAFTGPDDTVLVAVISAAISAHRARPSSFR